MKTYKAVAAAFGVKTQRGIYKLLASTFKFPREKPALDYRTPIRVGCTTAPLGVWLDSAQRLHDFGTDTVSSPGSVEANVFSQLATYVGKEHVLLVTNRTLRRLKREGWDVSYAASYWDLLRL